MGFWYDVDNKFSWENNGVYYVLLLWNCTQLFVGYSDFYNHSQIHVVANWYIGTKKFHKDGKDVS